MVALHFSVNSRSFRSRSLSAAAFRHRTYHMIDQGLSRVRMIQQLTETTEKWTLPHYMLAFCLRGHRRVPVIPCTVCFEGISKLSLPTFAAFSRKNVSSFRAKSQNPFLKIVILGFQRRMFFLSFFFFFNRNNRRPLHLKRVQFMAAVMFFQNKR